MAVLRTSGPTVTHEKEDLSDVIYEIDPSDVPFLSNLRKGTAKSTKVEWTVQELQTVDGANKQAEGADFSSPTHKIPDRFENACQIALKWGHVSDTYSAVDTVGSAREFARQKVLEGKALKRDIENIVTSTNVYDYVDPRGMAGVQTWITNVSVGATGSAPGGDGKDAPTPGTPRAFDTAAYIDDVMQQAYLEGGEPRILYMTVPLKPKFSALPDAWAPGTAHRVNATSPQAVDYVGAADSYLSDFGRLDVVVSRFMFTGGATDHSCLLIDPRYVECHTLPGRNFMSENMGKGGDHDRFKIAWEGTLHVSAPKAHGAIHALDPAL